MDERSKYGRFVNDPRSDVCNLLRIPNTNPRNLFHTIYLVKKMEYSDCHERGTKKKSKSPTGIEPMTSRNTGQAL